MNFLKQLFKKKEQVVEVPPKQDGRVKPVANESFWLHLNCGDVVPHTIYPTIPFTYIIGPDFLKLIIHADLTPDKVEMPEGLPFNMLLEYTNDPTVKGAGQVVSLGYYAFRIEINSNDHGNPARITNWNPFVVETNKADIKITFRRPQKNLPDLAPQAMPLNTKFTNNAIVTKTYLIPQQHDNPFPCYVRVIDPESKQYYFIKEYVDLTNFFAPLRIVNYTNFKTKKACDKFFMKEISKMVPKNTPRNMLGDLE